MIFLKNSDIAQIEGVTVDHAGKIRRRLLKKLNKELLSIADYCRLRGGNPIMIYSNLKGQSPDRALVDGWKAMGLG